MRQVVVFVFAIGLIVASVVVAHGISLTDRVEDVDFGSATLYALTVYPNPALVAPFPERTSMLLLGTGLVVLAAVLRKRTEV